MKNILPITTHFVDVGGVLLNNGWDHLASNRAAKHFAIKWTEMEMRHNLTFELHEEGKLMFENYRDLVTFYEKRNFTRSHFRSFVCDQSRPFPAMIELVKMIKRQNGLKVVVVSNESREINSYRIKEFKLGAFVDFFVSSCFVGLSKPDTKILRFALDLAQVQPGHVIYLENTPMFVEIS